MKTCVILRFHENNKSMHVSMYIFHLMPTITPHYIIMVKGLLCKGYEPDTKTYMYTLSTFPLLPSTSRERPHTLCPIPAPKEDPR